MKKGERIRMMGTNAAYDVERVSCSRPRWNRSRTPAEQIGFITAAIEEVADTHVGDTITDDEEAGQQDAARASKPAIPVVFCGLFPADANCSRRCARR